MIDKVKTMIGKYEVLDLISQGNMGRVYLAYDPFIKRQVALKVDREILSEEETQADRDAFFNEAHAAGKLAHDNIIKVFDAGIDQGHCFIAMEFVEGGLTLKDYCREDNLLDIDQVLNIGITCCNALGYAHSQGVMHRDIKPSNILISPEGVVTVADFSIAHVTHLDETATMPVGAVGSPRYMSPEQLNEEVLTEATDIYSLGVVLFELLTGRHPFPASSFSELIQQILQQPTPRLDRNKIESAFPRAVQQVIFKSMQKDPLMRYQDFAEMASVLSAIVDQNSEAKNEKRHWKILNNSTFFSEFSSAELDAIFTASECFDLHVDESMSDHIIAESLFVILQGNVIHHSNSGKEICLDPGDCFGEMNETAKLEETIRITALSEVRLLKLTEQQLADLEVRCQVKFLQKFLNTLIARLSKSSIHADEALV